MPPVNAWCDHNTIITGTQCHVALSISNTHSVFDKTLCLLLSWLNHSGYPHSSLGLLVYQRHFVISQKSDLDRYGLSTLLGTPVQLHIYLISVKHKMQIGASSFGKCSHQPSERGECDFYCGVIVGARRAGFSISTTADHLRVSCTTVLRVYSEKTSLEQHLSGQKRLVVREINEEWPDLV